jgi:hypothetical protein
VPALISARRRLTKSSARSTRQPSSKFGSGSLLKAHHTVNLVAVSRVESVQRGGIWEASPNLRINSGNVTHKTAKLARATATAAAPRP